MDETSLQGATTVRDIKILSPVQSAYKTLSSFVSLPAWEKVIDYLNDDAPITTSFLIAPYQEKCCTYGKLYEGRRLASIVIKPVIGSFVLELKVGERYLGESPKIISLYIKNIKDSDRDKGLDLIDYLGRTKIDFSMIK